MRKLPLPRLTPEGKEVLLPTVRNTLIAAAFVFFVIFLLVRCAPVTQVEPPSLDVEFYQTCGEKQTSIAIDKVLIHKVRISSQGAISDTTRFKYQGHFGNVPSGGIKMLGLPGTYEVVATFRQVTQSRVVVWENTQSTTLKFFWETNGCKRKGGSQ